MKTPKTLWLNLKTAVTHLRSSKRPLLLGFGLVFLFYCGLGIWWSIPPSPYNVTELVENEAAKNQQTPVIGYATTSTLIFTIDTLLNKPGGYLSNDVTPPGVVLDNMPSWEFGVLEMSRDLILSLRKDLSRSQSQSMENQFLTKAQPALNIDSNRWILPSSESQYRKAVDDLRAYRQQIADLQETEGQFYARSDNLRSYLKVVEKRLGSMSQKLSASKAAVYENTALANDRNARQSSKSQDVVVAQTSWFKIDNNFYEARGACWALLHFLRAVEIDFKPVLEDKNALVSLRQIIRELEQTQQRVYSPMILNGSGFGMLANHSLVMANYISRANAALIELSELLNQG